MESRVALEEPLVAPAPVVAAAWVSLAYLSVAHFFIDFYSNALGVFVPLLVDKLGISLTEAGFLGGLLSFSSSVTQPLYGYLSDRFRSPLFATLAPAVAGIFIASLGLAPSYAWLIALVFLGGAGVASFHPAGSSRVIVDLTPEKRQMAMAVFISCGSLGLACGPSGFSYLFDTVGASRAYFAAIPGVVMTLVLLFFLPPATSVASKKAVRFDLSELRPVWEPLTILYFCVFLRSLVQITFSALLPLYLHKERGYTLSEASHLLSFYLAAGAIGGFIGGNIASRFGGKRVIQISFLGSLPLLAVFFLTTGWVSSVALVAGGFLLLFTIPVNVVMAQELAPTQAGTVSALMMGASWGMAGLIGLPLIGWVGDHYSLHVALGSLVVAPLLGWVLTLRLKTK